MTDADTIDRIDAVRRACSEAGEQDPLDEASVLHLKHQGLEGARAWTEDGGFALVRDGGLELAVAPNRRGQGLGGRLLGEVGDAARLAWSHGDHPAAARLADAGGWERARELWVMRRPTSAPLPELVVPDDLVVRGFDDGDTEGVLAVNAAAFADHPEQGALDLDGFRERTAESWWSPAGLLVAAPAGGPDAGEVLGFHWTKQHSPTLGEVYVVGVGPRAQGRGLGRLLTLAGLHHLAGLGVDEVLLYVESDNLAARHVYESLGFTHAAADTHVQYAR